jgi:hypothetical protein
MVMTQTRPTVLIIDDDTCDREAYRRFLIADRKANYQILEEESAESALAACRTNAIDGILLDFFLPDMDGLEFLGALKAQLAQQCPPILMITGQGNEAIAVKAFKSGVEDYLIKSEITAENLQASMRSAIENARLRQQLQQCNDRFRTAIENMFDCFGIYSAIRDESGQIVDFRIDYMNAAAMESNCMTQAHIGQRLCELLPAHHETGLFEEYCQVVETGEPLVKESLVYTDVYETQQLTRAFDIRVSKHKDGFVASWRDITAQKQAEIEQQTLLVRERQARREAEENEKKLRESEERFRQLAAYAPIGIFQANTYGYCTYCNAKWSEISGLSFEESMGYGWGAAIHPDERETLLTSWQQSVAAQRPWQGENRLLTKQGTIRWVNAIATPMFSPEGQLLGYVGTVEDITARKQAEEALRESEARLKLAMQSAQWGYWDLNLLTGESVWSSESKQLLGLPPDWQETNYETLISRIHPDDRLVIEQAVERAISSGNYETEFRVIWADGSIHWLEDRGQVYYDKTGRAVRMVGMVKDISDRKQTEAALHQNRALLN